MDKLKSKQKLLQLPLHSQKLIHTYGVSRWRWKTKRYWLIPPYNHQVWSHSSCPGCAELCPDHPSGNRVSLGAGVRCISETSLPATWLIAADKQPNHQEGAFFFALDLLMWNQLKASLDQSCWQQTTGLLLFIIYRASQVLHSSLKT